MNSREIIHQFVNMARHPEAGSYEQVCEKIKFEAGSLILHTERSDNCGHPDGTEYACTVTDMLEVLCLENEDTLHCKMYSDSDCYLITIRLDEAADEFLVCPEVDRYYDGVFYDQDDNVIDLKKCKVLYRYDNYLDENGGIKEYLYRAEDGNIYYKDGDETEEGKSEAIQSSFDGGKSDFIIQPYTVGRPITAFDVCWALQKTHTDLMIRFNGGNYIRVGRMMGGKFDCWFWLETIKQDGRHTDLDEWSDEVCDKIAENC